MELHIDGGSASSHILMQIQSDIFGFNVIRQKIQETTALSVACLTNLFIGYCDNIDDIKNQ